MMTRLFGNKGTANVPWGTIEQNGVGRFDDISDAALEGLAELGVTHVWYTGVPHHALIGDYTRFGISNDDPDVVKGRAGSPYAVKDYYSVNPDLARDPARRLDEFRELVQRTHDRGMKVIIDIVPNHVARRYRSLGKPEGVRDLGADDDSSVTFARDNNFYYVAGEDFRVPEPVDGYRPLGGEPHPLADGQFAESPARWTGNGSRAAQPKHDDWFETIKINHGVRPDGSYAFDALPSDYANRSTAEHFEFWRERDVPGSWKKYRGIVEFWIAQGVDGFRYDMAEMVPVEFWSYLNSAIKQLDPDAFLLAEVYNPSLYRDYIHLGRMDFLYDKVGLYDTLVPVIRGAGSIAAIDGDLQAMADIDGHLLRFLENHDELRIASPQFAGDPRLALPAMVVSALSGRGPVMIYFGQEVGEPGDGDAGFGDPGRTTIFDYWGVPAHQRWMNGGRFDGGQLSASERHLRDDYATLLRLASGHPAMAGNFVPLKNHHADWPERVYGFARVSQDKRLVVISNFDHERSHDIELRLPEAVTGTSETGQLTLRDLLSSSFTATADQGRARATADPVTMRLQPLQSMVLELHPAQRAASVTGRVEILPPLQMAGLDRARTLRVYLPPGYENAQRRFPVLYMHDGQNLFDDATSYVGEWGVDEVLDELASAHDLQLIVVGVDHGGEKRMNELSPWANARFGPAEGELYGRFLVARVKPFIDRRYRTLPGRDHTAIMGSSMGGLMSHYLALNDADVFGAAGIFSPSYWFSEKVTDWTRQHLPPADTRLYLMMGAKEGDEHLQGVREMRRLLVEAGHPPARIKASIRPEGEHNEPTWRRELPEALLWLFQPAADR